MVSNLRITERFRLLIEHAVNMYEEQEAAAILLIAPGPGDWARVKKLVGDANFIVVAEREDYLAEIDDEADIKTIVLEGMVDNPVYECLMQAILQGIEEDYIKPGSQIIALYGGFETETINTISCISLKEHLDRLTNSELRMLETSVPLDTLKTVVNLAIEIGRSGREGKPVGTLFVVGDAKKVLAESRSAGFDPVRGYSRTERNLMDPRVREGIKEIAQLDGAIIVEQDGTVAASCRILDSPASNITLSKGLGSRHWAAAATSRSTKAIAIAVSETNGTVRIFQNGEVVLRIEPSNRKPLIWKGFEYDSPED
ncbi:MAG: DNA integrity scanning protein DisA nucleotide-binding domain protein [Planctomycetia bacterium]|nr:DNA integrity scanning protein DisA nucleotide-binding domain protein [Planctomycetia bacterium]